MNFFPENMRRIQNEIFKFNNGNGNPTEYFNTATTEPNSNFFNDYKCFRNRKKSFRRKGNLVVLEQFNDTYTLTLIKPDGKQKSKQLTEEEFNAVFDQC